MTIKLVNLEPDTPKVLRDCSSVTCPHCERSFLAEARNISAVGSTIIICSHCEIMFCAACGVHVSIYNAEPEGSRQPIYYSADNHLFYCNTCTAEQLSEYLQTLEEN